MKNLKETKGTDEVVVVQYSSSYYGLDMGKSGLGQMGKSFLPA